MFSTVLLVTMSMFSIFLIEPTHTSIPLPSPMPTHNTTVAKTSALPVSTLHSCNDNKVIPLHEFGVFNPLVNEIQMVCTPDTRLPQFIHRVRTFVNTAVIQSMCRTLYGIRLSLCYKPWSLWHVTLRQRVFLHRTGLYLNLAFSWCKQRYHTCQSCVERFFSNRGGG